ncbi:hypothetical protein F4703DRAFT_1064845 [Phycomyces blakesleeanus]
MLILIVLGLVIIHPKSPTKTNAIRLRFTAELVLSIKAKEIITLFEEVKVIPVGNGPDIKAHILEAKQHTFPFEFIVPEKLSLPSSMELDKGKSRIHYTLTAIHDRPMIPESLCPKAEYCVRMLEKIDTMVERYQTPQEKTIEISLPWAKKEKCTAKLYMPRRGYTQGDTIPLNITVNHFESLTRSKGITIQLIRMVDVATAKNTVSKQHVLRCIEYNLNLTSAQNFTQNISSQVSIPTSTPPSMRYKQNTLVVHYKIRVRVNFSKINPPKEHISVVELPITLGTWPRAAIPIDDDDEEEEDISEFMDSLAVSEDDFEDDNNGKPYYREPSFTSRRTPSDSSGFDTCLPINCVLLFECIPPVRIVLEIEPFSRSK